MTTTLRSVALQAIVPVALVATWWFASEGSTTFYFPPLRDILSAFADNWLFERWGSDVLPSLQRLALGFLLATVVGVGGGMAIGLVPAVRRLSDPLVEFVRAIPPTALVPLGILLLGVGSSMKVFVIAIGCVWPILLNTIDGVRSLDPTLADTTRVYEMSRTDRLRLVVLPSASPQIFAGLRTSLSLALILMVISEMVASTNGLGHFVIQAQRSFDVTDMWSGIILLGLLGFLLNGLFLQIERRVLAWHRGARAAEGL